MEDTDIQREMKSRIRKHMLTSIGGVLVGMFLVGGLGAVVGGLSRGGTPGALAILPILGIAAIPAIGFWSTFTNLRCPSCNGLVAMQVSWKYSAFGSMASDECRHCGKTIFSPDVPARFRKLILITMAIAFALAFLGAGASIALRPHP